MDHSKMNMQNDEAMADHSHMPVEIPENLPKPQLELTLFKDEKSGYNLHIETNKFELEPPEFAIDKPTTHVQGHAHLFVNGVKIQRIYANYLHLPDNLFKEGINQVMVTLNNHDHKIWTRNKLQVVSSIFLEPKSATFIKHNFSASPIIR